jgi:hypothetical protein
MINGRFVCYGDKSYLKQTYGEGYSIIIKHTGPLSEDTFGQVSGYMQRQSSSSVKEETQIQETSYKLKKSSLPLSKVFETL